MADGEVLTGERLDECWTVLRALGKEDGRRISLKERSTLREAGLIVNKFQLYIGKGGKKEEDKEEAADVTAPAAQEENP